MRSVGPRRLPRPRLRRYRLPPKRRLPERKRLVHVAIGTANHFELTATLIQRDVMRYTPSGMPLIDCVLHHVSEISEAGQLRQVEVDAPALAFESIAQRLATSRLDEIYRFSGFVANRSRKSKRTVFHITAFESISLAGEASL